MWHYFQPLIFFMFVFPLAMGQSKKALIIANSKYDPAKYGWRPLNAKNDVTIMREFFSLQNFDDIKVREDVTKAQMVIALTEFQQSLKKGDIAHIHISSHGQQVFDADGDELDGFDEAIVPVDCPANSKFLNSTERHFTDDELYKHINVIRKQIGASGSLILSVDACHSGSISRGLGTTRGGHAPFIPEGKSVKEVTTQTEGELSFLSPENANVGAQGSFILITAAHPDQLAYEHKEADLYYGSLSFAIAKTTNEITSHDTYRSWFSLILRNMAKLSDVANRPQIEGQLDKELYGGKMIPQAPYYNIIGAEKVPPTRLMLNGGSINGLIESTSIWLLPAGTIQPDKSKIVAKGRIEKTGLYSSWVMLEQPLPDLSLKQIQSGYWAFRSEQPVPVKRTAVYTHRKSMISAINSNILEWAPETEAELKVGLEVDGRSLEIINNRTGETLVDDIVEDELPEKLHSIVRADFLRSLKVSDPEAILRVRLIKAKTDDADNFLDTLPMSSTPVLKIPVFTTDDAAVIEISNPTNNKLYFNLLDIQPDGKVNIYLPRENYSSENCFIEPGRTIILKDIVRFEPPFGEEYFKIFASKMPLDLSNLGTTRGLLDPTMQALEAVFSTSIKMETRGPVPQRVPSGSGSISDFIFRIEKKQ